MAMARVKNDSRTPMIVKLKNFDSSNLLWISYDLFALRKHLFIIIIVIIIIIIIIIIIVIIIIIITIIIIIIIYILRVKYIYIFIMHDAWL
jgi:type IV secretory pathway component VirB8